MSHWKVSYHHESYKIQKDHKQLKMKLYSAKMHVARNVDVNLFHCSWIDAQE